MTGGAATLSVQKQWHDRLCGEKDCKDPIHEEGRCVKHYRLWRAYWRDICPGRCNDRWREADTAYRKAMAEYGAAMEAWAASDRALPAPPKPERPDIGAYAPDPVWCARCTGSVRLRLAEISDLAAIVEAENLGLRKGPESERVSGSRHPASPSPAGDNLEALGVLLREWEGTARAGDTYPRRGYLASEIATYCARLSTACFPLLMAREETAVDFGEDVFTWYRRLKDATRTGTGRHPKNKVPCSSCKRYSLVWEEGNDHVECQTPSCRRLMRLSDYEDYERLYPYLEDEPASA